MTLDQIYYFIEIAKTGSMSQAAINLHVSQPNISLTVKSLEEELGYKLFYRSSKGVELTCQGAEFLYYAETIVKKIQQIKDIKQLDNAQDANLTISVHYMSYSILPIYDMINLYENQKYNFKILQKSIFDVIEDVSTGHSNIGLINISNYQAEFMNSLLNKKNLEFCSLCELQMFAMFTKNHPLSEQSSIQISDLKKYPLVIVDYSSREYFMANAIKELKINSFPKRIVVTDFFHWFHIMKSINAVSFALVRDKFDFNLLLKNHGLEVKMVPLDKAVLVEMGYIKKAARPLSFIEQQFFDSFTKIINENIESE